MRAVLLGPARRWGGPMCRLQGRGNRFAGSTPLLATLFSEVDSSLPTQAQIGVERRLGGFGRSFPSSG